MLFCPITHLISLQSIGLNAQDQWDGSFLNRQIQTDQLILFIFPDISMSMSNVLDGQGVSPVTLSVWAEFRDQLYQTRWNAEIKETFNGYGNAIEYLGRYTNRIAITNARIKKVTDSKVTFSAKDYKTSRQKDITISCVEFIRRFMMHVLPSGFQKIRYYGFLNNRSKKKNLITIFKIQGHQKYQEKFSGLTIDQVILTVWNHDIRHCSKCGSNSMRHIGRTFAMLN